MAAVAEQLRQAEAYKEEGNTWFKEGNYKKALGAYHKVFCYVNGLQAAPERASSDSKEDGASPSQSSTAANQIPKERADDVKKLKQSSRLNMAFCYLKLGEHQKCVDACSKALELGSSSKAYFRRGQAFLELRNMAGAKADLERARELTPNDSAIVAELRKLRSAYSKADPKEKKNFAKMFETASVPAKDREEALEGPKIEEMEEDSGTADTAPVAASASSTSAAGETAEASVAAADAEDAPEDRGAASLEEPPEEPPAAPPPVDLTTRDEASKPDVAVRELTYAWQQSDDDVKIYIPFDQSEELQGGVDESRLSVDFGEWSVLLVIQSTVAGRTPLGLRLGDFHRRVLPDKCTCTVRSSRITLKLVKRVKENWWNLLQHVPLNSG